MNINSEHKAMTECIGSGSRVTLHFSLAIAGGAVVDSTFEHKPATFVLGDGNVLPGFGKKLLGLRAGDQQAFLVAPEEGFGQPNPGNVQRLRRSDFGADIELTPGLVMSFDNGPQGELPGVIASVEGDAVVVDFNHPLAGRTLQFTVQILAVQTPN